MSLSQQQVRSIAVQYVSQGDEVLEKHYEELFEHYLDLGEIPYGTAKARTGDPFQWISDKLCEVAACRST
jgi:hypothetical protein